MAVSGSDKIESGGIIFLQGEKYNYNTYLESGTVEILAAGSEYNGLDKTIILSHSRRVSLISESTILMPYPGKTVRALTQCSIQKRQLPAGGFAELSSKDQGESINMLVCMFKRMEVAYADMAKYLKHYQALSRFVDNMTALHCELSARPLPRELQQRADDIVENLRSSGGFPPSISPNWMIVDNSEKYQVSYDAPGESVDVLLNKDLYSFLKRFLKINKTVFAHVIKCDPGIPSFMFDTVQKIMLAILDRNYEIAGLIDAKMKAVFSDKDSLSSVMEEGSLKDWATSGRLSPDFLKQFNSVCQKFYSMYDELTGKKSQEIYTGIVKIKKAFEQLSKSNVSQPAPVLTSEVTRQSAQPQISRQMDSNILKLYENSLQQILEFGVIGYEQQQNFIKAWNEFKRLPDPMSGEDQPRKVRRSVSRLYWDIFTTVFVRAKSTKNIPAPVKLMFRYGFIDENVADPEQIMIMHQYAVENYNSGDLSILTEEEFLTKIWNKEEPPSMTEMGQSYEAYLRELSKTSSRKGPDPMDDLNDPIKQVTFEISNRIFQTSIVCSGSISTAFPIFNNFLVKGNIENCIMTKAKIEAVIKELIDTDYSAFFRETVLKLGDAREVIEEEVLPHIIILPVFGMKTMMWQELVGINKRSRARIVVPAMFVGDIVKSLAHSIAVFRWEILRTMKGGMWADPVEGGLTGAYQDYVQFYKKNSKLSVESKEKILERLRSHRNNIRELFAEDYILWVRFEKNGIMKMNNVSRDLFYRYVPFKKDIRERLERMPAFMESANRFKNIRKRTFDTFERKFRKYTDENGNMPDEIRKYMNYLQM